MHVNSVMILLFAILFCALVIVYCFFLFLARRKAATQRREHDMQESDPRKVIPGFSRDVGRHDDERLLLK